MECVELRIMEDTAVENGEELVVLFRSNDAVNVTTPSDASVTILDDDGMLA